MAPGSVLLALLLVGTATTAAGTATESCRSAAVRARRRARHRPGRARPPRPRSPAHVVRASPPGVARERSGLLQVRRRHAPGRRRAGCDRGREDLAAPRPVVARAAPGASRGARPRRPRVASAASVLLGQCAETPTQTPSECEPPHPRHRRSLRSLDLSDPGRDFVVLSLPRGRADQSPYGPSYSLRTGRMPRGSKMSRRSWRPLYANVVRAAVRSTTEVRSPAGLYS
jgi:hypothetical protein